MSTITVTISTEGFESHDDAVMAVCTALDWYNDLDVNGYLQYEGDTAL